METKAANIVQRKASAEPAIPDGGNAAPSAKSTLAFAAIEEIEDPKLRKVLLEHLRRQKYVLDLSFLVWYRKYFGPTLIVLAIALVAIAIMAVVVYGLVARGVEREYFAYDSKTGVMVKLVPLDQPMGPDSAVLDYASRCVVAINTYDFVNYRAQMQQAQSCFTDDGWNKYMEAINRAGSMRSVINNRMVATAAISQAPVITRHGLVRGTLAYEVEVPTIITYSGGQAGNNPTQRILIKLLLTRIPAHEGAAGLAITQYIAEDQP